jgi:hypothetical protein
VPRFDYETHVHALTEERRWPESTSRISELRLVIEYQSARRGARNRTLTLDIVDYPGEWLLDLPLLTQAIAQWSADTLKLSHSGPRVLLAARWHKHLATLNPDAPENEQVALQAAALFTDYLKACRNERYAMRLLPPGRFLMPGDLAGSPALTFAPLELSGDGYGAGIARRHDGAALRVLQGRGGAAVLSRAFRAARPPDRAGRCARRVQRRPGCREGSGKRASPRFSARSAPAARRSRARCSGRASTAFCLPPPRPTICITPVTTSSSASSAR